jgi:hypothetical protein
MWVFAGKDNDLTGRSYGKLLGDDEGLIIEQSRRAEVLDRSGPCAGG